MKKLARTAHYLLYLGAKKIEKMIYWFRKEADIHIDCCHYFDTNERKRDSFSIYVTSRNKCWMISGIDWNEAPKIVKLLENSKGKVELSMSRGIGREYIIIPEWAKPPLAEKINKELAEEAAAA